MKSDGLPDDSRLLRRAYRITIALNAAFMAAEAAIGVASQSLGLVSDAGHKLADTLMLVLALVGFRLSQHEERKARRISALIALINSVLLGVAVCIIIRESILKFSAPVDVDGTIISWTAGVGILVSGLGAWLLMRHRTDINTRAAFLHLATDSLLSLGVVVSGIVIRLTGASVIDPIVSLVIASVLLFNTLRLLRDAVKALRAS